MHSSMVFMSRNFQLSPLVAERYSLAPSPCVFVSCLGRTVNPCAAQSSSEMGRSLASVPSPCRSILPLPKQTLLTIKCEWMCSRSMWVAMSASLSGHALAANIFASSCANSPVTGSLGAKDCTLGVFNLNQCQTVSMQIGGQLDSASGRCSTQAGFQRILQQIRENQAQIDPVYWKTFRQIELHGKWDLLPLRKCAVIPDHAVCRPVFTEMQLQTRIICCFIMQGLQYLGSICLISDIDL